MPFELLFVFPEAAHEHYLEARFGCIEPIFFRVIWLQGRRGGVRRRGRRSHRDRSNRVFVQLVGEALFFLVEERLPKGDLLVEILQLNFAGSGVQFERSTTTIQGGHGVHRPVRAGLNIQGKRGVGFDAAGTARIDGGIDRHRKIARNKNHDVAGVRSELGGSRQSPPLVTTSMGPATYMTRIPPPPVCARTEPRASPKSIWPPPVWAPT